MEAAIPHADCGRVADRPAAGAEHRAYRAGGDVRRAERDGKIRRRLDVLPNDREIAERRSAGIGLVIPEFCVLLAATKIDTTKELLASALPDDPYLQRVLVDYFPSPLRQKFSGGFLSSRNTLRPAST